MKIKFVVVETESEYKTWIAAQKPAYPMQLPGSEKEEEINSPVENQVEESVVIIQSNNKKSI
jgi:heme/copper-type cytochrome/quinol oxidase subunit 2